MYTSNCDKYIEQNLPRASNPNCGSCAKATVSKSLSTSNCPTTLPLFGVVNITLPEKIKQMHNNIGSKIRWSISSYIQYLVSCKAVLLQLFKSYQYKTVASLLT